MIECPACGALVPAESIGTGVRHPCERCGRPLQVEVYAALAREHAAPAGAVAADGEASCFFHAGRRAERSCDACGRFVCALCACAVDERTLCPDCLAGGQRTAEERFVTERPLYDSIALSLATVPLLFFYLTLFTAPIALFLCLRYWKRPTSLLPRTKVRFVIALVLASLQIVGWAVGAVLLVRAIVSA